MEIRLQDISKRFGDKEVIRGLDLRIHSGAFTTLLGPSGCGKTTLLRMIAGLETPDTGEIWFDDRCLFSAAQGINLAPEKRGLGFVFQDFALWPHMTVFENVAFGLRARGNTQHLDQHVKEALATVRLADYAQRYPHQLSGGQQQRVAFARAMVIKPPCILFDEPLSALDAALREEMRLEIKQLTRQLNITSVFVTHDQAEAMSMSDYVAVMDQGTVLQHDTPEIIYHRPAAPFVAHFIGKSNWLDPHTMVRPERMQLAPDHQGGTRRFDMRVASVQYMGEGYQLLLKDDGRTWQYHSPDRVAVDARVPVYLHEDDLITFDEKGVSA